MSDAEFNALDELELPPLTMETADDDGINNLRNAIVLNACAEYAKTLHAFRKNRSRKGKALLRYELDKQSEWFRSEWFKRLTMDEIDGDKIIYLMEHDMPFKWLDSKQKSAIIKKQKAEAKRQKAKEKAERQKTKSRKGGKSK